MALVVADTSALVSLGTVAVHERSPLDSLLDVHEVVVPEQVVSELGETASFEDASGEAAGAVLDRLPKVDVQATDLDADVPLDDGENAAVILANDLDATQLLCDEFNSIAIVHATLATTRLVTTPTLLTAFVRNELLTPTEAEALLETMSEARSWDTNAYVAQAAVTLQQQRH